ncbi:MAG: hypothetical protein WDK96_03745 [Candidatus Paceibacterota bacterium]|jgi:hypothetical protein
MRKNVKNLLKIILITILFLVIIIYAFLKTKDMVYGVKISVDSIKDGQTIQESLVTIHGKARNAMDLMLNDRKIFIDKNGIFNEQIVLLPGYNIINLKADDKFGKKDEKNIRIFYREPPNNASMLDLQTGENIEVVSPPTETPPPKEETVISPDQIPPIETPSNTTQ